MKLYLQHFSFLFLFCCLLIFHAQQASAQMTIDGTMSDLALAQTLAGEGVTISNVVFDCGDATAAFECTSGKSYGFFDCTNCNVGLGSGVLLTSGCIDLAAGPNDSGGATGGLAADGDPDLDMIPGVLGTNDACALYLDVEVAADTLKFNYVFGSEEYLEFVGSFNDVFAFYISGPNPAGGNYNMENIAVLPGTSTYVSINNVNDVDNSSYYVNNGTGTTFPNNSNNFYIQYDGFTVVLEARAAVVPCQTYSLKLVVADDLDTSLDSGVFIEAGSLTTNKVTLTASTALASAGFLNAVEGCVDGIINFSVDFAPSDTAVIFFEVSGMALNGIDFVTVPDSIILLPGTTSYQLIISPIADGLLEGLESLKVKIINPGFCTTGVLDSVELFIQDNIIADAGNSPILTCPGSSVQLGLSGGIICQWLPPDYLDDPTSCFPIATPLSSITYTAITSVGPCIDTAYVQFIIDDNANPQAQPVYNTCAGQNVQLNASGGLFYLWTPTTDLSCSNCPDPIFSGADTTSYIVRIFDAVGCETQLPVTVNVGNGDLGLVPETLTVCNGQTLVLDLGVAGADSFNWSPATGLSCTDCPNPTVTTTQDITYTVTTAVGSCSQTTTRTVVVSTPEVSAGGDFAGCETYTGIIGSTGLTGYTYLWSPATGLDDATAAQPQINLTVNSATVQTYSVTATDANGCVVTDELTITLDTPRSLQIAQPDTIVEGSGISISVSGGIDGDVYAWSPAAFITDPNKATVFVKPGQTTEFTATVTTPLGCSSEVSVTVFVVEPPRLLVPSSFSPNGDGVNDILRIVSRDVTSLQLFTIYNRWGQMVYENNGNLTEGWNGMLRDEEQPIGVYVYYIEYYELGNNQVKIAKGNVTLIR